MANWYVTPDGNGARNGTNWSNSWRLTDINWGNVGATDTIYLSGGVYTDQLKPLKSGLSQANPLKIERSLEAGYDGPVGIFGGRSTPLLPSKKTGSTGGGTESDGIFLGSYQNIQIDGKSLGGITVHGWNKNGIAMWSNNGGGHTLRNLWIYDNGSTDSYSVYEDGIAVAGSGILIEDCIILDNRADAIQGITGGTVSHLTVRRCLLGNTRNHPDNPAFPSNYLGHSDGIQMPDGTDHLTVEDCVFINSHHGLIPDETDGPCTDSFFERLTFINCATTIRHKHGSSNRNTYRDWVVKKWRWYPNDNGIGYLNGTSFNIRGSNHTFENIFANGGGAFVNGTSNSTFSGMYTDGSMLDNMPNQQIISDPQFANPGPEGDSGQNLVADWQNRSLKSGNSTISSFANPYYGPLHFFQQVSGIEYTVFPENFHATQNNAPYFKSLPQRSVANGADVNYQVDAGHPDGSSLSYAVAGPSWLSIGSTGVLSGSTTQDGTYTAVITVTGGGKSAKARITIVVGSGGGGGGAPMLENPGTKSNQVGSTVNFQPVANDPDGDALTWEASGLPVGLDIDETTGRITGTPQSVDTYNVSITVDDGNDGTATQDFTWVITTEPGSGSTTLLDVATQKVALNGAVDVQVAVSNALSLTGEATDLPPGVELEIVQPVQGSGSTSSGGGSTTTDPVTVDTTTDGQQSDGPALIQNYNFGPIAGHSITTDFILTLTLRPHPDPASEGAYTAGDPTLNGTTGGFTQVSAGGTSGTRLFQAVIDSTHPLDSVSMIARGIAGTSSEQIHSISNGGTAQGMGSANNGLISWAGLGGLTQVLATIESTAAGNNSGYGFGSSTAHGDTAAVVSGETINNPPDTTGGDDITVDTTTAGLVGSGAGLVQVYNLGDHAGNVTITQYVEPANETNNPRTPNVNGSTGGYTQFAAGSGSGLGFYRVRLVSNRPLKSLVWAARGIAEDPNTEDIDFISNGGSATGLGSGSTGTVTWSDLPEETMEVYFIVVSNSSGNNAGFGPIGNAVLHGDSTATVGEVRLVGAPTFPGVKNATVQIGDSNGDVGPVEVRFEIPAGDGPDVTAVPDFPGIVGEAFSHQVVASSPQSPPLALKYYGLNFPPGITIDEDTGLISGSFTQNGNYTAVVMVRDAYNNCQPIDFEFLITGGQPFNLNLVDGPAFITQPFAGVRGLSSSTPEEALELIGAYEKAVVDAKDQAVVDTLRDGIVEDHNSLQLLKVYFEALFDSILERLTRMASTTNHILSPGKYSESTADGDMGYRRLNLGALAAVFPLTAPLEIFAENDTGTRELIRLKNKAGSSKLIFRIGAHGGGEMFMYDGVGTQLLFVQADNGTLNIETSSLPTSNPGGTGKVWSDNGTLKIT